MGTGLTWALEPLTPCQDSLESTLALGLGPRPNRALGPLWPQTHLPLLTGNPNCIIHYRQDTGGLRARWRISISCAPQASVPLDVVLPCAGEPALGCAAVCHRLGQRSKGFSLAWLLFHEGVCCGLDMKFLNDMYVLVVLVWPSFNF